MPAIKRNFILPTGIGISAETLFVNSSIGSTTTSTGSIVSYGGAGIAGSLSLGGRLQLFNSSNYTAFISSASGNTTYTLPATSPATGSSVLQSTSAGVMSWVPMVASSSGTTSNNVNVTLAATNASHPILFTPATSTVTGAAVSSETSFVYNPSTDILSVSGLAVTSGLASTSFNTGALVVTGGVGIGGSLTVNGDLTVNGTTTTINSVTLTVDDKNIELGSVNSPSDITAEAGGITLKGATDKFINWYTGTGWSSNESFNLASGLVYKIANTSVLSASSIGTGITNSSLTALGTITTGTWAGSTITARYGGTGITSYTVGDVLYANTTSTLARITAGTAGSVLASAGAGATPYYADPNVLVTSSSGTTSRNVNVTSASTNSTHYLAFTPASSTVAGAALSSGSAITANPNTGTISATTFTGATGSFTTVNAQGSTASTYFGNGALVVSGGAGISGQLSFNSAALGYTGATNPSMAFIGSTNVAPITLTATSDGAILFEGSSGKLFGINNNLSSGWIFNVGDISGLPIIRANADGTIAMTEFMANVGIGLSNPQYKLHVTGSVGFTASTQSTTTTSGALIVTGGVGIGQTLSVGGRLNLWNPANTFYTSLVSGASAANQTYTLPTAYPGTGTSILQSDTSGTLSWVPLTASSSGTTSANVNVSAAGTSNLPHYLTFITASGSVAGAALSSGTALTYNPNTATLYATNINATTAFTGNLTGIASTGRNVDVQLATTNATHAVTFTPALSAVTGSATSSDATLVYNPSTKILTTSGLAVTSTTASISTSSGALTISGGVGIGGSLNVTSATGISGVTINAGVVTGSLTGTATTATNINVGITNTSSTVYPVFSGVASTTTGTGLSSSGSLSYVPSTGTLSATAFVGSLTGFATTGRNVNTVAAGSSNVAHLMLFSTASGTVSGAAISNDTTFSFNPSTEILSVSGIAVTAGTASTNSATGALRISGGLGVSGQLSFNTASLGSTGYSNPSIIFSGSAGSAPITLTVQSDNTLSWEGTSGQLFAIDNNLTTGDIFSVSDISGLPIINASAGQTVSINEFGGFTRIGNGSISSTGASNANADGSLVVYGGVGITGNMFIAGVTTLTNGTNSSSTGTGAIVVNGGLGVTGNAYFGGVATITNGVGSSTTSTGSLVVNGGVGITGNANIGGTVRISNGANSGSSTSGTLVVLGGFGLTGNAFIGGTTTITNTTSSTGTSAGSLVNTGGFGNLGNAFIGGTTTITSTTSSISTTSGALVVSGGAGIGGTLSVGSNLTFTGSMKGGSGSFAKNLGSGDIALDNASDDTPAVLYYWGNNKNFGLDVFYSGSGTTKFRITKELNESGGTELWSIDRNGLITRSAYAVGEPISGAMYNYSDLGMSATTTISSTSYTTFATVTYTPKSSSSYIWIEFSATYSIAGTSADDHWSNIEVNGSEIVNAQQVWANATGGGTRSGVLFPLAARYTNSSTAGIAISVRAKRGTSDDNNTIYGNNASGFMRIQEIGR